MLFCEKFVKKDFSIKEVLLDSMHEDQINYKLIIKLIEYCKYDILTIHEVLDSSIIYEYFDIIQYIIEKFFKNNLTVLDDCFIECINYGNIKIINYLIDKGADINSFNSYALVCACHYNYYDIIKILLDKNIVIPTTNYNIPFFSKYKIYFNISDYITENISKIYI